MDEVLPEILHEIIALPVQPALALDKAEEEQPVQQRLRLLLHDFLRPPGLPLGDVAPDRQQFRQGPAGSGLAKGAVIALDGETIGKA